MTNSVISRALAGLFGFSTPDSRRVLMVGLDAAGKTTILYLAKLGEVTTTIPTIGFNVEDVVINGATLTAWDVGGCDKIRPLWRHYFQNSHAIIFVVDSSDRERASEFRHDFETLLTEPELEGTPILVMAWKQDLPGCMSVKEIQDILKWDDLKQKRRVACLPGCHTDREGLMKSLAWVIEAARDEEKARLASSISPSPASGAKPAAPSGSADRSSSKHLQVSPGMEDIETIMERWLEVEDGPDDEFLAALADFTLDSWDHRTHLRIAWLHFTRYGRREGMDLIFKGIKAFIDNSPRTKRGGGTSGGGKEAGTTTTTTRGTTFHETMTYFWAHMVHYAMMATKNPRGDFKTFLLLNPQLANGGMFLHYYSKGLMLHSLEARQKVVLPDRRPLLSLLTDVGQLKRYATKAIPSSAPPGKEVDNRDSTFLARFEARQLSGWGHRDMLRVIYCYLGSLGRRRAVDKIHQEMKSVQKEGYSCTITYFWIQMVTAALASEFKAELAAADLPGQAPVPPLDPSDLTAAPAAAADPVASLPSPPALGRLEAGRPFSPLPHPCLLPEFALVTLDDGKGGNKKGSGNWRGGGGGAGQKLCQLISDPNLFLKYYSQEKIFSREAAEGFVLPDKAPLPSIA